jgi:aldehyde dehydrogenase (NAD+)
VSENIAAETNTDAALTLSAQREFFKTGRTLDLSFRLEALKRLEKEIIAREGELASAVKADLGKSAAEFFMSEYGLVLNELREHKRSLRRWARPKRVKTPLIHFIAKSTVRYEPLGQVLIISPWNYPFNLLFIPLIGALSAGNTAILKPSSRVPNVSRVIAGLVRAAFAPELAAVFTGSVDVSKRLLEERFDLIFFTGSASAGRQVMAKAAENLTPVVLELGGKSPCVVHKDADIALSAKRIAWGKFLNAGQTCIAPDYVLAHDEIKDRLIKAIELETIRAYGPNPKESPEFARIVSKSHVERLKRLATSSGTITFGGEFDAEARYVSPTIVESTHLDSDIMREEIFGPVLPVLGYSELEDAIRVINDRPKPLALYLFTASKSIKDNVLKETQSGGFVLNDTIVHVATCSLPFGGVGDSGMGRYHGRYSFETFSHHRAVMERSTLIDFPVRYAPLKWKKWMLRLLYRISDYLKW